MKAGNAVLLLAAFVFNVIPDTEQANWTYVYYPNGTIEDVDLTTEPVDLNHTETELDADVLFYLYTYDNQSTPVELHVNNSETLSSSNFNASNPTIVVIHGWQNTYESDMPTTVRDAYLETGDYNVIVVDWSTYSTGSYIYARRNIVSVGIYVAEMIDYLEEAGSLDTSMLTVVGYSLGAHIGGEACRSASSNVSNLMALDPAGPLFYFTNTEARMTSEDAEFVEVIHTSAGRLGYNGKLGDADYWPNGGLKQRGCGADIFATCAHSRAYLYFAESLHENEFVARECSSYLKYRLGLCSLKSKSTMGGSVLATYSTGKHFLRTNKKSPFYRG
ncbi:pancreatic lipase-related protein 3-like [Neodiprion virginianus]|uniref:pancreatic lipase-related protein 3-like n=1 Tax=Neodiprion virginianus TaxID=2961670 RepID=UPI001EE767B0|nr:pancreatic lipase-related protein 3-like [Neodiprion virginianus]